MRPKITNAVGLAGDVDAMRANGMNVGDACRVAGFSESTYYKTKRGMKASTNGHADEVARLRGILLDLVLGRKTVEELRSEVVERITF